MGLSENDILRRGGSVYKGKRICLENCNSAWLKCKLGAELTGEASKHMLSKALKVKSSKAIWGVHTLLHFLSFFSCI